MERENKFQLICKCGEDLTKKGEDGVNGSLFFECEKCGRQYNVYF